GLSGLATGAIAFLSLHGLRERASWRWICLLALTAVALKTAVEFVTGQPIFAHSETLAIKPVPEAHIAGALVALLICFRQLIRLFSRNNANYSLVSSFISEGLGRAGGHDIDQPAGGRTEGAADGLRGNVQFGAARCAADAGRSAAGKRPWHSPVSGGSLQRGAGAGGCV